VEEHSVLEEAPLTLPEAAAYLKVSTRVVRDWCKQNRIRYSKLNYRQWRFRKADLDAFLDRRATNAKSVYA
jgi:excisionase family DNA binding protein